MELLYVLFIPLFIYIFFFCPPVPSPRELSGIGPSLSIELESSFEGGYEVSIFVFSWVGPWLWML